MRRFLVGGRVLKTALAITLSIVIAQQLGMERVTLAANHSSKRRSLVVAGMEVMKMKLPVYLMKLEELLFEP